MANSEYRQMTIDTIKMACQDVIDRIDQIVPEDTQGAFDISLSITIPSLTDNKYDIPYFTISMTSYPASKTIMNLLNKNKGAINE